MQSLRRILAGRQLLPLRGAAPACRRSLHLAPPFLLEDYTPRYLRLSSIDGSKKRSQAYAHLRNCNLCPRLCGVNRYETTGVCLIGEKAKVNVVAPHFGEGATSSWLPLGMITTTGGGPQRRSQPSQVVQDFHLYLPRKP